MNLAQIRQKLERAEGELEEVLGIRSSLYNQLNEADDAGNIAEAGRLGQLLAVSPGLGNVSGVVSRIEPAAGRGLRRDKSPITAKSTQQVQVAQLVGEEKRQVDAGGDDDPGNGPVPAFYPDDVHPN